MNVADLLTLQARATPDAVATITADVPIKYAALEAAVWSLATRFRRREELQPGQNVGLIVADPVLHLVAFLALARAGIGQFALAPPAREDRPEAALARVGAVAVITDVALPADLSLRVIQIDPGAPFGPSPSIDYGCAHEAQPDWPMMYKMSSGTTGSAKLIGASHRGTILSVRREQAAIGYRPGEALYTPVPLHFDAPKRRYLTTLASGGTAVLSSPNIMLDEFISIIERNNVAALGCVPSQAYEIAGAMPEGKRGLPSLRYIRLSAAPSDDRLREAIRDRVCPNLIVSYGCSELGPMTVAPPEMVATQPGTVGRAAPGVTLQIVDGRMRQVPAGESGLVRVRVDGMPSGYHDDAKADALHFRDGWFFPGDLGVLSATGELTLLGRADDVMIFDGMNISPREIEAALMRHPGVREAAAFPVKSAKSHQTPASAVVLEAGTSIGEVLAFGRRNLGSKAPRVILEVTQMPRNAGGKILKRELAKMAAEEIEKNAATQPAKDG